MFKKLYLSFNGNFSSLCNNEVSFETFALCISRSQGPAAQWHAAGAQQVLVEYEKVMSGVDTHLA